MYLFYFFQLINLFFNPKRETLLISMQRSESTDKIFMTMELSLREKVRDEDRQRLSF